MAKTKTKKQAITSSGNRPNLKRTHRISFLMNDEEFKLVQRYMEKYKVSNGSNVMREALIRTFLKQLDEDRPTLFD